jgi:diaminohydroxyphosphoribosylaminopyrimidine deaminase/5-amino-6-(5-phosphoribosylamino)uracil reductase
VTEPFFSDDDRRFMARALELAAQGDYRTGRNPKVGAVIVRDGVILAEGFHAESGGPHAEAVAFEALADAAGATLYVTLEPCGPFEGKRTAPCLDTVLASGVARVVVAHADPHPAISGTSLEHIRAAGITIEIGLLEEEARRLNGPYAKWVTSGQPYVTAKWAMSLDGKIACASGDSKWISGEASRRDVHTLRGEVDAILIGIGTAVADDPLLTRRDVPGGDPLRVVLDSTARLDPTSHLVQTAREHPLLIVTGASPDAGAAAALRAAGAEVVAAGSGERPDPAALLDLLAARDVRHLLIEGGGELLASFFAADLVDHVLCYVAPKILGGSGPTPVRGNGVDLVAEAARLSHLEARPSGEDVLIEGHLHVY